jgi:hypothetical protein
VPGDDVYIAGAVGAEVTPDAGKFWAQFLSQVSPGAAKVGQQLGDIISKPLAQRVAAGLADAISSGGRNAGAQGAKVGEDYGSKFAKTVTERIRAALESLPDAKLNLDAGQVDEKLAEVRAQLDELGTKHIGVDIDTGAATERIAALEAEIAALKKEINGLRTPVDIPVKPDQASLGRFAAELHASVKAAIDALPEIDLRADTTEADQRLAEIRAQLQALSGKRIGVDIDDAAAVAELRDIQEQLALLARSSPSVRVSADAASAVAELEVVRAEAERVGALSPSIHVDVDAGGAAAELGAVEAASDSSIGSLRGLTTAGIALGPAIIPVAAAVAAAIGGIGLGIAGVGAGAGVVALAVAPVIGAVSAMNAAQADAGKSAATLASRQSSLAGASDALRSAQAGVANATANAADAERRSAEQVANAVQSLAQARRTAAQQVVSAEQSVADAQRAETRATSDLVAAKRAEINAEQDLANQLADGVLAQRQATIDLATAQRDLDAAKAKATTSPTDANTRAAAQAQLDFDQAKQRITDLGTAQAHLTQQQQLNAKTGVDGASQVANAQQQVVTATQAVGNAQRSLADARLNQTLSVAKAEQALADARASQDSQARQSAASIASAEQGVVSAQRSLQAATVATGTAGGAAMDKLHQAMAALTPEGQRFATFLFGLKPIIGDLEGAAENGLLPGFQAGIEAILPYEPKIIGFITTMSRTVGDLAAEAGKTFTAPFWRDFFSFLGNEAPADLAIVVHALENVAAGSAGLFKGLAPLSHLILTDISVWSQRFATFGATVGSNPQFQAFIAYTLKEGPVVFATIGDIVGAIGHLAIAAAPIGTFVLGAIRDVATAIHLIPTPILSVLVGLILSVVVATKALELAQDASKATAAAWGLAQKILGGSVTAAKDGMAAARTATSGYGSAMELAKGSAASLKAGVGGLATAMGGPLVLAGAAAVVGLGLITAAIAKQKQRVSDLSQAMLALHDALQQAGSSNTETVKSIVNGNADLQRAIQYSGQYGLSTQQLISSLSGQKGAEEGVKAALDAKIKADEKQFHGFSLSPAGLKQLNNERTLRDALKGTWGQLDANADVDAKLGAAASAAADSTSKMSGAQQALLYALTKVADKTATAADKATALKTADDAIYGAARSQADANEALAATQDESTKTLRDNKDALAKQDRAAKDAKGSLDLHTQAGRDDTDAIKAQLKATNDAYFADIAAGVGIDEATKKHDKRRDALVKEAVQDGVNKGAVQNLVDIYGEVPKDVKTGVTVTGVSNALTQLQNLEIAQLALKTGFSVDVAAREWKAQHRTAVEFATWGGGLATGGQVSGPGTSTSDSIMARLSNREWVHPVAAVDYYGGGFMGAIQNRAIPREALPGFAGGGQVTWPFPVTAAMTRIPSKAEVARAVTPAAPAGSTKGLPNAVARWAGLVATVLNILHQPLSNEGAVLRRINFESGGNQFAINLSDSNAKAGHPSQGLMQTIPSTFNAYAGPFRSRGIFDPEANIYAGSNYAIHRYGSLHAIDPLVRPIGYDDGGKLMPGLTIADNRTGRPESIFTEEQKTALFDRAFGKGGSPTALNVEHFHAAPDSSPRAVAEELMFLTTARG